MTEPCRASGLKRLSWTAYGESVPQRVDRLTAQGELGPAIFAFPDAFTRLGGNQYVDSVALGGWETFVARDLVPQYEEFSDNHSSIDYRLDASLPMLYAAVS